MLAAVTKDGFALAYASNELKSDREIVLAAVKTQGLALEFESYELRNDRYIVLAAVKRDGEALGYASDKLQSDPLLRSWAVLTRGRALWRIARENHIVDSIGTFWFKQTMRAEWNAEGIATMLGRGAKRALEEYEEWSPYQKMQTFEDV